MLGGGAVSPPCFPSDRSKRGGHVWLGMRGRCRSRSLVPRAGVSHASLVRHDLVPLTMLLLFASAIGGRGRLNGRLQRIPGFPFWWRWTIGVAILGAAHAVGLAMIDPC